MTTVRISQCLLGGNRKEGALAYDAAASQHVLQSPVMLSLFKQGPGTFTDKSKSAILFIMPVCIGTQWHLLQGVHELSRGCAMPFTLFPLT